MSEDTLPQQARDLLADAAAANYATAWNESINHVVVTVGLADAPPVDGMRAEVWWFPDGRLNYARAIADGEWQEMTTVADVRTALGL